MVAVNEAATFPGSVTVSGGTGWRENQTEATSASQGLQKKEKATYLRNGGGI